IRRGGGKKIGAFAFASKSFLEIKKGQLLPTLEGNDLAIEDHVALQTSCALGNFLKLIGHASQIAGKKFHTIRAAVQLRADPIVFVFDENHRLVRLLAREAFPDRLRSWLGTGEHDLDWTKERQLGPIEFVSRGKEGGLADIA